MPNRSPNLHLFDTERISNFPFLSALVKWFPINRSLKSAGLHVSDRYL